MALNSKLDTMPTNLAWDMKLDAPPEELYEWTKDRWQVTNLAGGPKHQKTLETLRARLDRWIVETGDRGPESEKMYDSDMAVYVGERNNKGKESVTEQNIRQMKQWAAEGK